MRYLAFVTMELYPLTGGGMGRAIYNMIATMAEFDRNRTLVICAGQGFDQGLARAACPQVRFESLDDVSELQESDRHPPHRPYSNTDWHWHSVCVLRKLRKLEGEGVEFDYIEFSDWGGLGFAATQEKLFSAAFSQTTLAVRLHNTEGVIHSVEAHFIDKSALALYDIERKALRDCDRVVAQLLPAADYVCDLYGFDREEWERRLVLHAPPVLIDQEPRITSLRISLGTPILFTSKFQEFKAPDT